MNLVCLFIWIGWLIVGIVNIAQDKPLNPIVYICACIVCICSYLEKMSNN